MKSQGPEKILNRVKPCNCGCRGRDSWHAQRFSRVLHDVEILEAPELAATKPYGEELVIARAWAQLPYGKTPVAFVAAPYGSGQWYPMGWVVLR